MTYDDVITMLEEAGLPLAYDHFAEGESPDPPFLVFLYPGSDNMFADDTVFKKIDELNIELYTDVKDPETETQIEDILIAVPIGSFSCCIATLTNCGDACSMAAASTGNILPTSILHFPFFIRFS